jgi:hypothetical protein
MVSNANPKYKFKEDFIAKLCNNYMESYTNKTPCKSYEDLVFKRGNVFQTFVNNINTDPTKVVGLAKMIPFVVPLNILEKVDNSTPITDVIQGDPEVNKAKKQAIIDAEEKRVKMMFVIPTILILAVVWVYGIKKL